MADKRRRPWMIAAWPGMGSVAMVAATYLIEQLQMEQFGRIDLREFFDINETVVHKGILRAARVPRGLLFRTPEDAPGRPIVAFVGEAQPPIGTYAYAQKLAEAARKLDIERMVTFASMASALDPADNPRVFGVATNQEILEELDRLSVDPLADGQIGGLNGVALAAAAEQDIPGMGLLAEIPFFAANVANPKAARAALSVFSVLGGLDLSLAPLDEQAKVVDRALIEAFEKLKAEHAIPDELISNSEDEGDESLSDSDASEAVGDIGSAESSDESQRLDFATRQRIEQLFEQARNDRSKAMTLKQELDRLGVFKDYEDRFLDLFRRAD